MVILLTLRLQSITKIVPIDNTPTSTGTNATGVRATTQPVSEA
jgi:hypothetical protein